MLFIRPVYKASDLGAIPLSLALCRTNGELIQDSDVCDHFPNDSLGVEIREAGVEFHGAKSLAEVKWGEPIFVV